MAITAITSALYFKTIAAKARIESPELEDIFIVELGGIFAELLAY